MYTDDNDFICVDVNKFLKKGNLITIRPHTRFIDIPEHNHTYIEVIYVLKGNIIHVIDNEEISLNKGDLLFLNFNISHKIKACNKNDVAINFIIKKDFFNDVLSMLEENNYIKDFIINLSKSDNTKRQFLLFNTFGILPIENILENLIYSIITNRSLDEVNINKKLIGILFMYLYNYTFLLEKNFVLDDEYTISKYITNYIETEYKTAKLSELAKQLNSNIFQISRFIKSKFGQTFKEMLQNKKFEVASNLLIETNLSISDIISNIGYENNSYFHKRFKQIFSISPAEYRKRYKK